jgi:uncharacterized damage-inducible protein DinB
VTAATLIRPAEGEYAPYYAGYVAQVPDGDVVHLLEVQMHETAMLLKRLDESLGEYRYAPGKWTLKEVIGHLADGERVFCYRALRFARGDATPLASFDENAWAPEAHCEGRTLADLTEEFHLVRQATIAFVRSLTDASAVRTGTASGKTMSVRALVYVIAGHERHHLAILRERYLNQA